VVDAASLTPEFRRRLDALAQVEVEENRALLTLVGQNASRNPSNLTRATQRLCQTPGGAVLAWCSDSRFAFVLAAQSLYPAAEALHHEFFDRSDPDLFVPNRASVTVMERAPVRSAPIVVMHSIQ
jgi:aspartokinase